jgi:cytoskeleton protein RodZ
MDSFGTKLKREREKQKVTLDDVSISTKIGTRFLQALENDRFQELPGGIFNKGFVRAYARHLGLDEDQTLSEFALASGEDAPKQVSAGEAAAKPKIWQEEPSERTELPWGYLVVALIVVGFGLAFWGIYSHERQAGKPREMPIDPAIASQPVSPQPVSSSTLRSSSAVRPGSSATGVPVPVSPASSRAAAPVATAPVDSAVFTVSVHLHQDTWISITTDGESVARGILPADARRTIHGRSRIVVRTGNAGATDLAFNGSNVPIAGAENEVKTFTFDSHGLESPAPAAAATAQP